MTRSQAETNDLETVIGEGTLVAGTVAGDDDLRIAGRLDGTVELGGALVVDEGGILKAEAHVRTATIHGVVVGTLTASELVELGPTARVVGDVVAPRVIVAEGAAIRGRIDMGELELSRAETERSVRPVQVRPLLATPRIPARPAPARPLPRMPAPTARPAPVPRPISVEVPAELAASENAKAGGPPAVPASANALGARRKVVVKKK